jgi:hypothetical protein
VKLNHYFNKHSTEQEFTLRVLSIRDKISKLSDSITLNDTFYMEFNFKKEAYQPLNLKQFDFNIVKGSVLNMKE